MPLTDPSLDEPLRALARRLEYERNARRRAEVAAESATRELREVNEQLRDLLADASRANDELQAVNQAMRDFVAIASHDLRGPLTSVIGYSDLLVTLWDTYSDEQRLKFITIIRRQGLHLHRLVEDLLTVSKIEAGALSVHAEVVRLRDAMRSAMEDFSERADEIKLDVPEDLNVRVDRDHLQRIVTNFVTNALKYGQPPVQIEASDTGEWIEIRVRDHGRGIAEEFLPRLFGKFARADDELTRAQIGTGLGLSIVQGLAHANGGETWYEPNVPNGSCFAVRLPKAAA